MKASVVHTLGQPPRFEEFLDPEPQQGEVLIQVRAAGLHPVVRAIAKGAHYSASKEVPFIPGLDGVGTRADGARVYFGGARRPWGTMAEQCSVPSGMTIPLPDGIEDTKAAAIANPGMSAWLSLSDRGELVAGETVLIMGATGVAGHLAIQIARQLGAKRILAAGRNEDVLKGQDVDGVIGLSQPEDAIREALTVYALERIDVVIDYLWGRPTELLLDALAKGFKPSATHTTRLVEVGQSAGSSIQLRGETLRSIDLRILGSGFGAVPLDKIFATLPKLFDAAAAGLLTVEVDPVPLSEVESAWERPQGARRTVFTL